MKARKVKKLDPAGSVADNFERIVRVRREELFDFMPRAARPDQVEALHDMRIAAKRLRYILEIAHPCFGEYARTAVKSIKELQDLLGEIHDCDVQGEEVRELLDRLIAEDAGALAQAAAGTADVDPAALREAPNRARYAGLVALLVHLQARRQVLFDAFLVLWRDLERRGFGARLEFALSERPGAGDPAESGPPAVADEEEAA